MAKTEGDLDPLWQDLDWWVTYALVGTLSFRVLRVCG